MSRLEVALTEEIPCENCGKPTSKAFWHRDECLDRLAATCSRRCFNVFSKMLSQAATYKSQLED